MLRSQSLTKHLEQVLRAALKQPRDACKRFHQSFPPPPFVKAVFQALSGTSRPRRYRFLLPLYGLALDGFFDVREEGQVSPGQPEGAKASHLSGWDRLGGPFLSS
jgi:hypothetical protein